MNQKSMMQKMVAVMCALSLGVGAVLAQSNARVYEVKAGDTLYGISRQYGTTVEALKAANGIGEDNIISIGQMLVIPSDDETITTTTTTTRRVTTSPSTTTTTTRTETRDFVVPNTTFQEGDVIVSLGLGLGSVGDRPDRARAGFTQKLMVEYCLMDGILNGSSLGVGLTFNNFTGGRYTHSQYFAVGQMKMRRHDFSFLANATLHHQWIENLDTYAVLGLGVGGSAESREFRAAAGTSYSNFDDDKSSACFAGSLYVGARYYLDTNWAIMFEAGLINANFYSDTRYVVLNQNVIRVKESPSFNLLNVGVAYKF